VGCELQLRSNFLVDFPTYAVRLMAVGGSDHDVVESGRSGKGVGREFLPHVVGKSLAWSFAELLHLLHSKIAVFFALRFLRIPVPAARRPSGLHTPNNTHINSGVKHVLH